MPLDTETKLLVKQHAGQVASDTAKKIIAGKK